MMTLPFNIKELCEKGWLGVQLLGEEKVKLNLTDTENNETNVEIEPRRAYPVPYVSLIHQAGIMQIDEGNAIVFTFDNDAMEFLDTHSEVIN